MTEAVNVNVRNKIVYGAIAGVVSGTVESILAFFALTINLGSFNEIEWISQVLFGTTAGNPNLMMYFITNILVNVFGGIIFGIVIFLLMTKAGWERDRTRYLIVAFVLVLASGITVMIAPNTGLDLLIDAPILLIVLLIMTLTYALVFYYLEEQFESAS